MLIDQYHSNLPEYSHDMYLKGYDAYQVYAAFKKSQRKKHEEKRKKKRELVSKITIPRRGRSARRLPPFFVSVRVTVPFFFWIDYSRRHRLLK